MSETKRLIETIADIAEDCCDVANGEFLGFDREGFRAELIEILKGMKHDNDD